MTGGCQMRRRRGDWVDGATVKQEAAQEKHEGEQRRGGPHRGDRRGGAGDRREKGIDGDARLCSAKRVIFLFFVFGCGSEYDEHLIIGRPWIVGL